MALRFSGRLRMAQVMPSSFSTSTVLYSFVAIDLPPRKAGSLRLQVPAQESQALGPDVLGRGLVVARPVVAEKRVAGVLVEVPFE